MRACRKSYPTGRDSRRAGKGHTTDTAGSEARALRPATRSSMVSYMMVCLQRSSSCAARRALFIQVGFVLRESGFTLMIELHGLAGDGRSGGCVVRARASERGCARVLWRARLLRACVRACVRACICVKEDPVGCGEAAAESAARESPPPSSLPPSLLPASPTKRRKKKWKKIELNESGKKNSRHCCRRFRFSSCRSWQTPAPHRCRAAPTTH